MVCATNVHKWQCDAAQRLLLDGIGLSINDMRRLARWHGRVINPALASASASMMVAQKIARMRDDKRRAGRKGKAADKVPALFGLQSVPSAPCIIASTSTFCLQGVGEITAISRAMTACFVEEISDCACCNKCSLHAVRQ